MSARNTVRQVARYASHVLLVLTILCVSTFTMLELLPGSVADAMLGESATAADIATIEHELGVDQPAHLRFAKWLYKAAQGDLGKSPLTGESVTSAIADRLPVSLQLTIYAQFMALAIAVPFGIWAGYRANTGTDRMISGGAFAILAIPHFVLGLILILFFAIKLRWLPATGYVPFSDPVGNFKSLFLPSLTLALVEAPLYLRLLRSDIANTLKEEFITVARAKGLGERKILLSHALRPSSFSLITIMGIHTGHLIGGAVIIESLFALPGVGRLLVDAVTKRDFVTLQGVVLFIGVAFVLVNVLINAMYAVLDPRVGARHGR